MKNLLFTMVIVNIIKVFFILLIAPSQPFCIVDNKSNKINREINHSWDSDAAIYWDGKYIAVEETRQGYYDNGEEVIDAPSDIFQWRMRHLKKYAYIIAPIGTAISRIMDRNPVKNFLESVVDNDGITKEHLKVYLNAAQREHDSEFSRYL